MTDAVLNVNREEDRKKKVLSAISKRGNHLPNFSSIPHSKT